MADQPPSRDDPHADNPINVLLVGGGGREHALATAIARSPRLGTLFATHTTNPGIAALAKPVDVPVSIREIYRLRTFCDRNAIGLVVVGPEDPLAEGYADELATDTRLVFGPSRSAARLEADKSFAKQLMRSASVPTADAKTFTDYDQAVKYIVSRREPPVVKAAGLAKGKGVFVTSSLQDARDAAHAILERRVFGDAGSALLVEEKLTGPEVSVLAFVDGSNIYILETAQDHKRLNDHDEGPNTGGMGAFTPSDRLDDATLAVIQREILVPTIDALRREGIEYQGLLYTGLMLTPAGPKVLEYNVRFGDPECQALLPRLETDLLEVLIATCEQRLDEIDLVWTPGASVCLVMAAPGYPESPEKNIPISGLEHAEAVPGVHVFHAGTTLSNGKLVSAGGRVLNIVATAGTREAAADLAYEAAAKITFPGAKLRTDIGRVAAPATRRQRPQASDLTRTI
ncbi:MAG: phosphoribosylamine--glycine ligase [Planctomycetota bacterium]